MEKIKYFGSQFLKGLWWLVLLPFRIVIGTVKVIVAMAQSLWEWACEADWASFFINALMYILIVCFLLLGFVLFKSDQYDRDNGPAYFNRGGLVSVVFPESYMEPGEKSMSVCQRTLRAVITPTGNDGQLNWWRKGLFFWSPIEVRVAYLADGVPQTAWFNTKMVYPDSRPYAGTMCFEIPSNANP